MKSRKTYLNVRVDSSGGFRMAKLVYRYSSPDHFQSLMSVMGISLDAPVLRGKSHQEVGGLVRVLSYYLRSFCSGSFCIASGGNYYSAEDGTDNRVDIFVGFRNEKDLFKFCLKIPGAEKTQLWNTKLCFNVYCSEDDEFEELPDAEHWNREDPQGFLR